MAETDYDFSATRSQVIARAFRQIGALALGESLTADQEAIANEALNALVKTWESSRTFLWKTIGFTIDLEEGVYEYEVPTATPLVSLDKGFVVTTSGNKTLIDKITKSEWYSMPDSERTGDPYCFAFDGTSIFVYPTPAADIDVDFFGVGVERMKDWDLASETGEFPSKWLDALVSGLASRLATEYNLPSKEKEYFLFEAEKAFRQARGKDDNISTGLRTKSAFYNARGVR